MRLAKVTQFLERADAETIRDLVLSLKLSTVARLAQQMHQALTNSAENPNGKKR